MLPEETLQVLCVALHLVMKERRSRYGSRLREPV
jgi:hypothetical protein